MIMVQTRCQLKNLSEEELIEELTSVEDMFYKLSGLTSCFESFLRRYETSISDQFLESNICKVLFLTGHEVKP